MIDALQRSPHRRCPFCNLPVSQIVLNDSSSADIPPPIPEAIIQINMDAEVAREAQRQWQALAVVANVANANVPPN